MPVDTVDLDEIELMKAGTWNASTGRITVTAEDFESMVAAQHDPLVDKAPVKIGHTDPRFATQDGTPAFGWVTDLRTGPDANGVPTLFGKPRAMPAKLAARLKDAFRHRSAEVSYGVRTAAGQTYRAVFKALALLGIQSPAIKSLEDVSALYADAPTAGGATSLGWAAIFMSDDTPSIPDTPAGVPDSDDRQTSAADGGTVATYPPQVLAALKLGADATDEQVIAAVTAATAAATGDASASGAPAAPAAPAATAPAAPAAPSVPAQVAASTGPETVMLSKAVWEQVQADLAAAKATTEYVATQRRDGLIQTALSEGRIAKEDIPEFVKLFSTNQDSATTLLTTLQPKMHTVAAGYSASQGLFAAAPKPGEPITDEMVDSMVRESMATIGITSTSGKA